MEWREDDKCRRFRTRRVPPIWSLCEILEIPAHFTITSSERESAPKTVAQSVLNGSPSSLKHNTVQHSSLLSFHSSEEECFIVLNGENKSCNHCR